MENTEQQLVSARECADGWMSAYYRQTSRLLRAESALRDVIQLTENEGTAKEVIAVATTALEELKSDDYTDNGD
jgi:hypothetical protein